MVPQKKVKKLSQIIFSSVRPSFTFPSIQNSLNSKFYFDFYPSGDNCAEPLTKMTHKINKLGENHS